MTFYITQNGDTDDSYEQFRYPAGELQVRLTPAGMENLRTNPIVYITWRIASSDDLIALLLLRDAIGGRAKAVHLALPYLPYSRADRPFRDGDCFGLNVFLSQLRGRFDSITSVDVHSPMATALGVINASPQRHITAAIHSFEDLAKGERITVLYPDKGAATRGYYTHGYTPVHCEKQRDPVTGLFSRFTVPPVSGPVLILDDICDGGGTFLGIAKQLDRSKVTLLGLYVTHGIFSKGMQDLEAHFDRIYTTSSFLSGAASPKLTVYNAA